MRYYLLLTGFLHFFAIAQAQNKLLNVRVADIENTQWRFNNLLHMHEPASNKYAAISFDRGEGEGSEPFLTTATRPSSLITSWKAFTGSMDVYGLKYSHTKPLQYSDELGMVTFMHTKSNTYSVSPIGPAASLSGAVVAMLSINAGLSWDSICVWNNDTSWARNPQGGIYNPPLNTYNYTSAHLVTTGFTLRDGGIKSGNFFATKKLCRENFNNVASSEPGAQKFISHSAPFTEFQKTDLASFEFVSTDDGRVRALGVIVKEVNASTPQDFGYRGARVLMGTFSSGIMLWSADSIVPNVTVTNGVNNVLHTPYMAWNESGSVGYVFHIGCLTGATGANAGYQPIIYKTTNSGVTWSQISGIDFNLPSMNNVLQHIICTTTNTNLTIPFFNALEGISATVDNNNKLHIVSTLRSTSSSHPDSLGFTLQFLNQMDGETYSYPHTQSYRPYIYDFKGDGINPWTVTLIDSMSSEKPGELPAENGYATNPWRHSNNQVVEKVSSGARIQVSRTPDGKYIVYTWAESDTLFTANSFKWNELPNIKARIMDVTSQSIHTLEINISKPGSYPYAISNISVNSRAYFHTISPKCIKAQTAITAGWPAIVLPITVSRNSPLYQDQPVLHRYAAAVLNFENVSANNPVSVSFPWQQSEQTVFRYCSTGISSQTVDIKEVAIYPNPANHKINFTSPFIDGNKIDVSLFGADGRIIYVLKEIQMADDHTISIDTRNLSSGIYLTRIISEQLNVTAKIIIDH